MSEWTRDPGAAAFATSGSPTKVDAGGRHARARGMDEAYLDRQFVQGGLQESQSLEYKASAALGRQSADRSELCKDVSAFANAGGGMVIYGIAEHKHDPTGIDQGVDSTVFNKEWIQNVLTTGVQPKLEHLEIAVVDLPSKGKDRVAFVIRIGQATALAPHQNGSDNQYYRRANSKVRSN